MSFQSLKQNCPIHPESKWHIQLLTYLSLSLYFSLISNFPDFPDFRKFLQTTFDKDVAGCLFRVWTLCRKNQQKAPKLAPSFSRPGISWPLEQGLVQDLRRYCINCQQNKSTKKRYLIHLV